MQNVLCIARVTYFTSRTCDALCLEADVNIAVGALFDVDVAVASAAAAAATYCGCYCCCCDSN